MAEIDRKSPWSQGPEMLAGRLEHGLCRHRAGRIFQHLEHRLQLAMASRSLIVGNCQQRPQQQSQPDPGMAQDPDHTGACIC
ncbi:MAG TPA: hypothetical protein VGE28_19100 [Pseudomonas sp.]